MYERFTDRARKVMQLANQEAQRLNHEYIGTEHILLGLVKEGSGVAAHALKAFDIDLDKIRQQIEMIVPTGPDTVTTGKLTPRSREVIRYAAEECKKLNHNYVGTEHLLLGLLRETEGVAAQVLINFGLKLSDVRIEVLNLLGHAVSVEDESEPNEPTPRRWTREEYYRMGDMGFFDGQRVELIEGEIMVLSPLKAEHYSRAFRIMELLRVAFATGHHIRLQGPIDFGQLSEPEPDVAVVVGDWSQYAKHHPKTAALIVEVSESRLQHDRTRKASLYARAGIADYWIVNLVDKQLEVRRDPRPDPSQDYGHGYGSVTTLVPPAVVNPLAAPQISLAVAELLP